MKIVHHNVDGYENSNKKALSSFSTLIQLLKTNLLHHQWLLCHKQANQTSTEWYNSHDEKCAFYQDLSLLPLPGLLMLNIHQTAVYSKEFVLQTSSFRDNADTTKSDQITQPQCHLFTIWCTININEFTFIFNTSVRMRKYSENSWEDE